MDEPLVPTRDVFLCQAVVIAVFLCAQRVGYLAHQMAVGLGVMVVATAASAFLGQQLLDRKAGALNAYSVVLGLGALIFWAKWWVLG